MINIRELTDEELEKQIENCRADLDEAEYGTGDYNSALAELHVAENEKNRRKGKNSMDYNLFEIIIKVKDVKAQKIAQQLEATVKEWDVLGNYCKKYTRFLVLYGVIQALESVLVTLGEMTEDQHDQFTDILDKRYNIYYQEE